MHILKSSEPFLPKSNIFVCTHPCKMMLISWFVNHHHWLLWIFFTWQLDRFKQTKNVLVRFCSFMFLWCGWVWLNSPWSSALLLPWTVFCLVFSAHVFAGECLSSPCVRAVQMRRMLTLSKLYVTAFSSFQFTFNWIYGAELLYSM